MTNAPTEAPVEADKPVGPRSRKGMRTRARLLSAAKEIFEENGFLDARISDIAERAGLSHGSFYHYFESKEEIFREVAKAQEEDLSLHSIVASGLLDTGVHVSMRDRVESSVRQYLSAYKAEAAIMGVIEQVSRYDDEVRAARMAEQGMYTKQTEDAIRYLQGQGMADPQLDPVTAAAALAAMVSRFSEMWFVQRQIRCTFDEGVDQLATLCVNALQLKERGSFDHRSG
jgi:AcrR family transcriptional regulator